jgi:catalase
MQWAFWTLSPESTHQVIFLRSDRGTPKSWAHMNGYSSHTFMWINAGGEKFWVKYHFKVDQGIQNFTDSEAKDVAKDDPVHMIRDPFNRIARKDFPSWTLKMQITPFADAENYRFNPFDLTKVWPHSDYPLIQVGRMVLDRNPVGLLGCAPWTYVARRYSIVVGLILPTLVGGQNHQSVPTVKIIGHLAPRAVLDAQADESYTERAV